MNFHCTTAYGHGRKTGIRCHDEGSIAIGPEAVWVSKVLGNICRVVKMVRRMYTLQRRTE
jgi:hypothetical protein